MTNKENLEVDSGSFCNDEIYNDYDGVRDKRVSYKKSADARRRLERLMEEKALERLLKGDFNDWD